MPQRFEYHGPSSIGAYRFGQCRLLGHSWHVVPSDWAPAFGVPMTLRCERCDTERRMSISRNSGAVETSRYVYPDTYQLARENDVDPPDRAAFRLAWLDDQIEMHKQRRRHPSSRKATDK